MVEYLLEMHHTNSSCGFFVFHFMHDLTLNQLRQVISEKILEKAYNDWCRVSVNKRWLLRKKIFFFDDNWTAHIPDLAQAFE
jgi:hypothetical protein